ncbi:hypothetical protein M3Y96_00073800 [Aphelenchoides besseyi]|nr:hypothetical protein M3Y96_00073800 [Aphelenchoides besseyi]
MDSRPMLSVISATWSILSTTIVLSSVTIISSLAISVAEFNSFESDAFSKTPSIARMTCLLSVFLLGSTVFAMFGLSRKKGWMLLPQIGFSKSYRDEVISRWSMRGYYMPLWTCAVLMVLLFLLIISLFFVFIGLHFNYPGIIHHHVFALAISFPLALCTVVGGIATGGPFLVGFLIVLYFATLLPFAYLYSSAQWTTTALSDLDSESSSKA